MERWSSTILVISVLLTISAVYGDEYSITIVEDYEHSYDPWPCSVGDLLPWGTLEANIVEDWLGKKAGWYNIFRKKDNGVTKADFGVNNVGYQGLDEADFHFHFGHGYNLPIWGSFFGALELVPVLRRAYCQF